MILNLFNIKNLIPIDVFSVNLDCMKFKNISYNSSLFKKSSTTICIDLIDLIRRIKSKYSFIKWSSKFFIFVLISPKF